MENHYILVLSPYTLRKFSISFVRINITVPENCTITVIRWDGKQLLMAFTDTLLRTSHILILLNPPQPRRTVMRHRKVKKLAQVYIANKRQSQDVNTTQPFSRAGAVHH